jgi:hypothetical protein
MAASINGISDPFGRYPRGTSVDRTGRSDRSTDRSGASSATKAPLQVDFAQALEALERANAHVQNARLSFRQADTLRPNQAATYGTRGRADGDSSILDPSADPVRRGGLDLRG